MGKCSERKERSDNKSENIYLKAGLFSGGVAYWFQQRMGLGWREEEARVD